jgi:hypothetical protein
MQQLNPAAFNKLLNNLGQDFIWSKALACPCLTADSKQPRYDCPHCDGKGRLWQNPTAAKSGVVSREQMKKMAGFGLYDSGDILLSIPSDSPLYAVGLYDKVQSVNRTEPFSIAFTPNGNSTIKFTPVSIDSVVWLDSETNALINGTLPNIINGQLTWITPPPVGVVYTLTGRRTVDYYCYEEIPLDRAHHFGKDLPRRVVLRRLELLLK